MLVAVTCLIAVACVAAICCLSSLDAVLSGAPSASAYRASASFLLLRLSDPLGPSPLSIVFFLTLGLYLWAIIGLVRATALARFAQSEPLPTVKLRLGLRLSNTEEPGLRGRSFTWELALSGALLAPALIFWVRALPSFEWTSFDLTVRLLFLTLTAAVVFGCLQASVFWARLRSALHDHAASPMIEAYNRIANKVSGSFGSQLRSHVPHPNELGVSAHNLELLCNLGASLHESDPISICISKHVPVVRRELEALQHACGALGSGLQPTAAQQRAVHDAYFQASRRLYTVLEQLWKLRSLHPTPPKVDDVSLGDWLSEGRLSSVPTGFVLAAGIPSSCLLWIRAAEDFVAMRFTTWIYHVLDQIRWLLTLALLGSVSLVCAVFAYPLQPHRFMTLFSGSVLLLAAAASLRIILQLQSNEILHRLAPATRLSASRFNLLQQVVTYVALPVVVLAARVFPELGDRLFKFLEPLAMILQ